MPILGLYAMEPRGLKCSTDALKKLRADWLQHFPEMSTYLRRTKEAG